MKEKIEIEDESIQGNVFDLEAYNYMYNKSTSFIDGTFVTNDHNQLNYVLEELEKIDPNHLEILNYTQTHHDEYGAVSLNSALHKAVLNGN